MKIMKQLRTAFVPLVVFLIFFLTACNRSDDCSDGAIPSDLTDVTEYTVTFDMNGGIGENIEVTVGKDKTLGNKMPQAPTHSDSAMYFKGWSSNREGSMSTFSAQWVVKEDMTVYAIWSDTPTYYLVEFDERGGSNVVDRTVEAGKVLGNSMPLAPQREGFNFKGWSTTATGTESDFTAQTSITTNMLVYALWSTEPVNYTVTFDLNGGAPNSGARSLTTSNLIQVTVPAGSVLGSNMPTSPVRDGYHFSGWHVDNSGAKSQFCENTAVTQDITLYAVWSDSVIYYDVIFDANGGQGGGTLYVQSGKSLTSDFVIPTVTKVGYSFLGWSTSPGAEDPNFNLNSIIMQDTKLYAVWTSEPVHTVTFMVNGVELTKAYVEYGDNLDVNMPLSPTMDGYLFAGWSTVRYGTVLDVNFFSTTPVNQSLTVYAVWGARASYNEVYFDPNGGEGGGRLVIETGSSLGGRMIDEPVKEGSVFKGWSTMQGTDIVDFTDATTVSSDIRVYAVWGAQTEKTNYTVNFDANGGRGGAILQIGAGESFGSSLPVASHSEFYFKGWSSIQGSDAPDFFHDSIVNSHHTVYAVWSDKAVMYTVNFDVNGGTGSNTSVQVSGGSSLGNNMPSIGTEKAGFTFAGWSTSRSSTVVDFDRNTPVTSNFTVFAVWTPKPHYYTLTFDMNGGTGNNVAVQVEAGELLGRDIPVIVPERAGYIFGGWATTRTATSSNFGAFSPISGDMTVYAVWNVYYTVTFNMNGGSGSDFSVQVKAGESLGIYMPSITPVKEGFSFSGWATTANADTANFSASTQVSSNITLYAVWADDPVYFEVIFDVNGGTSNNVSVQVKAGETVGTLPSILTEKAGFTFEGWATTDTATTADFDENTVINNDITVYAVWVPIPITRYTVTFDVNGGTGSGTTVQIEDGGALGSLMPNLNPTKDDYRFLGWSTSQTADEPDFDAGTPITGNITVYAVWVKFYTVTFHFNGGTGSGDKTAVEVKEGRALGTLPLLTPTNGEYRLMGWAGSNTAVNADFDADTVVTSNMDVYAVWVMFRNVTFDMNGGSGSTFTEEIRENEAFGAAMPLVTTEKDGYTFLGWSKSKTATTPDFDAGTIVDSDTTVYAVWVIFHTVTFDINGGTGNGDGTEIKVKDGEALGIDMPDFTIEKDGYTFLGWSTSDSATSPDFTSGTVITDDVTVYAVWVIFHTVTFDFNNGNGIGDGTEVKVKDGEALGGDMPSLDPSRDDYTFLGWSTSKTATSPDFTSGTLITDDVRVYAVWVIFHEVTFNFNEGIGVGDGTIVKVKDNEALGADMPDFTLDKSGYTFLGWSTSSKATEPDFTDSTVVTDNITVYAVWVIFYEVEFDLNGGQSVTPIDNVKVKAGDALGSTMPSIIPEKTGLTFGGWSLSNTATEPDFTDSTPVNGNIKVYAVWILYHDVTFHINGGTGAGDGTIVQVKDGETLGSTMPDFTLSKDGYVFEGWSTNDSTDEADFIADTIITSNTDVYAVWAQYYTVTFNPNGGEGAGTSIEVKSGRSLGSAMPSLNLQLQDFTFAGWSISDSATISDFDASTAVTADTEVFAVWVANTVYYEVTFNMNGGTGSINPIQVEAGESLGTNMPTLIPTNDPYTFMGWSTIQNAEASDFDATTPITGDIAVYAVWVQFYTIEFNVNGGSGTIESVKVKAGESLGSNMPSTTPTNGDLTFMGWATTDDAYDANFSADTVPTGNLIVYAVWVQFYKVTFDMNGGTGTEVKVDARSGEALGSSMPSITTTNDGFTFLGWSTDKNARSASFDDTTVVNGNITVYAVWVIFRTVTFDVNGADTGSNTSLQVKSGDALGSTMPNLTLTKDGYTFLGWATTNTATDPNFTGSTIVDSDTTVYAVWVKFYTVTFDVNGAETGSNTSIQVKAGEALGADFPSMVPELTGYTFDGWSTFKTATEANFTASTSVTSDITVYAVWNIYYTVTFDVNGGTGSTNIQVKVKSGEAVGAHMPSATLTKDGFTFDGWATTNSAEDADFTASTPVTDNITVYAVWVVLYEVIFDVNGGSGQGTTVYVKAGRALGSSMPTIATEKDGYTFEGWSESNSATVADFTSSTPITRNMTVYAVWAVYYTVTFDVNGGVGEGVTVKVKSGYSLGANMPALTPVKDGSTFEGWATTNSATASNFDSTTPINSDIRVYAVWVVYYTVTFDVNGGTGSNTEVQVKAGYALGTLPTVDTEKAGHRFVGWSISGSADEPDFTANALINADLTVYAVWHAYFTVTFDMNGGTGAVEEVDVREGYSLGSTMPSIIPSKDEFKFGGWATTDDAVEADFTAATVVTTNITVYAVWIPYYTVTFDVNGGSGQGTEVKVLSGQTLGTLPAITTTKEGFEFGGWATTSDADQENFTATTVITGNIKVYAVWVANYTVTFDVNGGTGQGTTVKVVRGEALGSSMPDIVTQKDGFTFLGWSTSSTAIAPNFDENTPVTANIRVYAVWVQYVTVTFNPNDGSGGGSVKIIKGSTTGSNTPLAPVRDGFHFAGWSTVKGGVVNFDSYTIVENNITVHAVWVSKKVSYTVTFKYENGNPDTTEKVDAGATVAMPLNPSKTDYEFAGWTTDLNSGTANFGAQTPITGDITVYALWTDQEAYHTVTFDINDGSGTLIRVKVKSGESVGGEIPADPYHSTIPENDFDGWNTMPNGSGTEFTSSQIITHDMTIYATWYPYYTVTFYSRGNAIYSESVMDGGTISALPSAPGVTGRVFIQWGTQENGRGSKFTEKTIVNDHLNIHAVYGIGITNEDELDAIRNDLNDIYIILNDIEVSFDWEPMGDLDEPFTGILFGQGYEVEINMDDNTHDYYGLFGVIDGGWIFDIYLVGSLYNKSASAVTYTGAVAAIMNNGVISGSCYDGALTSGYGSDNLAYSGGIVGYVTNSTLTGVCYNGIIGNSKHTAVSGGIVGYAENTGIDNSFATSIQHILSGWVAIAGGIIGEGVNVTIEKTYTDMNTSIVVPTADLGGIAGKMTGGSINNSAALAGMTSAPQGANSARILANSNGTSLTNNHARADMYSSSGTSDTSATHGKDVPITSVQNNQSFFENTLGFDFYEKWKMKSGKNFPVHQWYD